MEGLVGCQSAVPCAGLRTDAPSAPATGDGGRHRLPFRYRGDRVGAGAGADGRPGKDVRIGGGAATIRQYLTAGLIDEMHLAISPILLGQGEPLFEGIDLTALGYSVKEHLPTDAAMRRGGTSSCRTRFTTFHFCDRAFC